MGTTSKLGQLPHDGGLGLDGTIYFTVNNPNRLATIGKVDPKTGAVKFIKADAANGIAANAHGLVRDNDGNFWFDVNPGRRALGKLDVKTDVISIYQTPSAMSPLGGAVTMDVDGKGKIWASTPVGAVRFDPQTEKFTEFKSLIPTKNDKGSAQTYGAAGDSDGNGWWAQMAQDAIVKGEVETGKTVLRDCINATVGFEKLGEAINTPPKSLMRMFSPTGNPQARNLFAVLTYLQKQAGVSISVAINKA